MRRSRALFAAWREWLPQARKFLPAARDYLAASLWRRVGLRIRETYMLDIRDWRRDLGEYGKLHVRFGKGSRGRGPKTRLVPAINSGRRRCWTGGWSRCGTSSATTTRDPDAPLLPSERRDPAHRAAAGRRGPGAARRAGLRGGPVAAGLAGRLTPHTLRHYCASSLYARGMDLKAIQELLGHSWLSTTTRYIHVHADHIEQAWAAANERTAARLGDGKEGERVRWNLRMKAAERGIWKSTEMRRRLAEAGLEISAGKMSALWTGTPVSIRLDDLDVICAVLDCAPADLLIREPDKVAARKPPAAEAGTKPVTPGMGRHRSVPPGMTGAIKHVPCLRDRPPAMREIPCCFECWPGGPVTPPPCRRCGSKEDYYTSGLCARCHTPRPARNPRDGNRPANCGGRK